MSFFRLEAQQRGFGFVLSVLGYSFLLVNIVVGSSLAQDQAGWQLEKGVERPSYAFTSPSAANVDIDALVLTCNEVNTSRILQLELYPAGPLPLMPRGADIDDLREAPHLQLSVDGRVYPVTMYFADDHILIADATVGRIPMVSSALVDGIANGHQLKLRFQLLAKHTGNESPYDGEATIDLQAGRGGAAIGTVRECVSASGDRVS